MLKMSILICNFVGALPLHSIPGDSKIFSVQKEASNEAKVRSSERNVENIHFHVYSLEHIIDDEHWLLPRVKPMKHFSKNFYRIGCSWHTGHF